MKRSTLLASVMMATLVPGCPNEGESGFGHGSPRPDCLYSADASRIAYYEQPVVVANGWSAPVRLAEPLTDPCPNDAIEISRNGSTLYFFWSPTVNGSNEELLHPHTGTYRAERVGLDPGVFGAPTYFELQKGVEGASVDGAPSFSPEGDLVYFHSTRSDNLGYRATPATNDFLDIYVAPVSADGEPGKATNLGPTVNSVHLDGEHGLHPDGNRLFLTSDRPGGQGGTDLWISQKVGEMWSDPVATAAPINTEHDELQPAFAANNPNTMYFVSNRDGPSSIYQSHHDGTNWSEPEQLITGYVGEPTLIGDGSVLYFVHVLVDDSGVFGSNIWYVQRLE